MVVYALLPAVALRLQPLRRAWKRQKAGTALGPSTWTVHLQQLFENLGHPRSPFLSSPPVVVVVVVVNCSCRRLFLPGGALLFT